MDFTTTLPELQNDLRWKPG